jgi:hypothetical protein
LFLSVGHTLPANLRNSGGATIGLLTGFSQRYQFLDLLFENHLRVSRYFLSNHTFFEI